jgi:adenylate cyclase
LLGNWNEGKTKRRYCLYKERGRRRGITTAFSDGGEQRLAAVMFTDIAGFTSLVEKDENLALTLLDEHRQLVRPIFLKHRGREVKTIGDSFLVEFASAVDAVECAKDIQQSLNEANHARNAKTNIFLRIGIHLGDVFHSENDIYGDAVNVASRIEPLAEPGGICVSRQVYESVRTKLREYKFESIGMKQLKNVEEPIEVFKVGVPLEFMVTSSTLPSLLGTISDNRQLLPKDRIAVLPFLNISPDPSDEFFADGLTEEMISRLSNVKGLKVIARTSVMNYKKTGKRVSEIGRELGVGTVVEGSVRKVSNRIRVMVQVINTSNDEHIWSSTYDRNLDDIFAIQDDIATKVAESISWRLAEEERQQKQRQQPPPGVVFSPSTVSEKYTKDIVAYTDFLQARKMMEEAFDEDSVQESLRLINRVIERDPLFAKAYALRATCFLQMSSLGMMRFDEGTKKAEIDAKKSVELDPTLPEGYAALAFARWHMDDFVSVEENARKAIQLNPSHADAYHMLAHLKSITGNIKEAVKLLETSYRLDPLNERAISFLSSIYFALGREQEGIDLLKRVERLFPVITCLGMVGYYIAKMDLDNACIQLENLKKAVGENSLFFLGSQGEICALKGEKSKALEIIASLEKRADAEKTVAVSHIGYIYYDLGDMDKFFEYMERANEFHALPTEIAYLPEFAKARKDPRFRQLFRKIGIDLPSELAVA